MINTRSTSNGWLIEKRETADAVGTFTLSSNGPERLAGLFMVANDARLDRGGRSCGEHGQSVPVSQGMPSVLVPALTVRSLS